MVGKKRFGYFDYPSPAFRESIDYEYGGKLFSVTRVKNAALFQNLNIWKEEAYRELQGTYPVIGITFANVKERTFEMTKQRIDQILRTCIISTFFC